MIARMLSIFALVVFSAQLSQAATVPKKVTEAIQARNLEFRTAVQALDSAAAASIYDPQVVFMAPDIPTLYGRQAVQNYIQGLMNSGGVDIQITTEEIRRLNSREYEEIGTNLITFNNNGQVFSLPGKYIVIWRFSNGINKAPYILRESFSFNVPTN